MVDEGKSIGICVICGEDTREGRKLCEHCQTSVSGRDLLDYQGEEDFRSYPIPDRSIEIDVRSVYDELESVIRSYLKLQDDDLYSLIASWIMATYHLKTPSHWKDGDGRRKGRRYKDGLTYLPYILFKGSPGCGKSLATKITSQLSYRGIMTLSCSIPYVTRVSHNKMASLGIDQLESRIGTYKKRSESQSNFRSFILSSYNFAQKYSVASAQDEQSTISYETFGARVLNSIHEPDEEISRRCVHIPMYESESAPFRTWDVDYDNGVFDKLRGNLLELRYRDFEIIDSLKGIYKGAYIYKSKYEMINPFLSVENFIKRTPPWITTSPSIRYMEKINSVYMSESRDDTTEHEVFKTLAQMVVDGFKPTSQEIINNSEILRADGINSRNVGWILRKNGVPTDSNRKWRASNNTILFNKLLCYYNIPKPESSSTKINSIIKKQDGATDEW